jgi:hypothetical protein
MYSADLLMIESIRTAYKLNPQRQGQRHSAPAQTRDYAEASELPVVFPTDKTSPDSDAALSNQSGAILSK